MISFLFADHLHLGLFDFHSGFVINGINDSHNPKKYNLRNSYYDIWE